MSYLTSSVLSSWNWLSTTLPVSTVVSKDSGGDDVETTKEYPNITTTTPKDNDNIETLHSLTTTTTTTTTFDHNKENSYIFPSNSNNTNIDLTPISQLSMTNDIEFQIRSVIYSWSFCWNRGDIIGYCNSYSRNARYCSINTKGSMTLLHGRMNITKEFIKIFQHCQTYQIKLLHKQQQQAQENEQMSVSSPSSGIAGNLEYSNIQIQVIPSISNDNHDPTTRCYHAIVHGHYTLTYTSSKKEQGIFTLHLIQQQQQENEQSCCTSSTGSNWQIQSEHSSAITMVNEAM